MRPAELKHAGHGLLAAMVVFLALFSFLRVSCLLNTAGEGKEIVAPGDLDNDTIDSDDNCKNTPNVVQADFDQNNTGDICQYERGAVFPDTDSDGIPDVIDWCTKEQDDTTGATGMDCYDIQFELNEDETTCQDDHIDHCDNCPLIQNQGQENNDWDDIGDACEVPGYEGYLRTRMVRISEELLNYGSNQDFKDSWIEKFEPHTEDWDIFGGFSFVSGLRYTETDEPAIAVAPGFFHESLMEANKYGAIVMIRFNEDLTSLANETATAGIVVRVKYEGETGDKAARKWYYCGLGKYQGKDALVIEKGPGDCEKEACSQGEYMYHVELPEHALLMGTEVVRLFEDEDRKPPFYILQVVKEERHIRCFLRSRRYDSEEGENVIQEISAAFEPLSATILGLRADGVKVLFKAAAIYRD